MYLVRFHETDVQPQAPEPVREPRVVRHSDGEFDAGPGKRGDPPGFTGPV